MFQLYAPTTLAPARDFLLLRYTSVMEDGSLVVCALYKQLLLARSILLQGAQFSV